MTNRDPLQACAELVRQADPDRYLSALFAPADKRPLLLALYAFNVELARIADSVTQPMLGEIRLQWWREAVAGARKGAARAHDVARGLAVLLAQADLPQELIDKMIDARAFDFSPGYFETMAALDAYLDATSGNLMRLAARVLDAGNSLDMQARDAGIAYGLAGALRSFPMHAQRQKHFLPLETLRARGIEPGSALRNPDADRAVEVLREVAANALAHHSAAGQTRLSDAGTVALLPAALTKLYVRRTLRAGADAFKRTPDVPIYRRQLSLFAAATRRRV